MNREGRRDGHSAVRRFNVPCQPSEVRGREGERETVWGQIERERREGERNRQGER